MAERGAAPTDLVADLSTRKFPSYVLYKYEANRSRNTSSSSADDTKNKDLSPSDTDTKDILTEKGVSLTVVVSSLCNDDEDEFRKYIAKRQSKAGFHRAGSHISGLELRSSGQLLCYYSLLKGGTTENTTANFQGSNPIDSPTGALNSSYLSNEYLICLIAPANAVLDLFRPELDKYCNTLLSFLDADPVLRYDLEDSGQLSTVATNIQPYLDNWFSSTTEYLCRSMKLLKSSVKFLIYAALTDADIIFKSANEQQIADIKRFAQCCSLVELINNHTVTTPTSKTGDPASLLVDISNSPRKAQSDNRAFVQITIDNETCSFNSTECTKFCEDWATTLTNGDTENPVFLRQAIDNFKLKAIQDMNNLRRLLQQAETDHYSLFRCFVFLKASGNAPILLQHVPTELSSSDTTDAMNILAVLHEFMAEECDAVS